MPEVHGTAEFSPDGAPAARGVHRLVPGTPPVIWQARRVREVAHA